MAKSSSKKAWILQWLMVIALLLLITVGMRQVFRIAYELAPPQASLSPAAKSAQIAPWRIILIHSYHQGFSWTDNMTRGVKKALEGYSYDLTVEYMDTKRHFSTEYIEAFDRILALKHQDSRFDLVITTDDDAFDYLAEHRDKLFPGVPWVFAGVNYKTPAETQALANASGISEVADLAGNVDLILEMLPETRRVIIVADDTTTGKKIQEKARSITVPALDIDVPTGLDFPGLATLLEGLGGKTVVLNTIFVRDSRGDYMDNHESAAFISRHSRVPVFTTWDFSLGYGVVGGHVVSGFQQGLNAGAFASRILQGERPESLPLAVNTPLETVFDFTVLTKWKIPESLAPPGSTFINHPWGLFEQNKELFFDSLIFIGILVMALVFATAWLLAMKRRNLHLEQHVEATTAELVKSEKLALLGGAVGSISHEVNAPLGLCITASTFLAEQTRAISARVDTPGITKKQLAEYMRQCDEVCQILLDQMGRAGTLMANFKELAVDQTQESVRTIVLGEYLQKIALSFKPRFRASGHELELRCPHHIELTLQPGALYQIMNNLILNALNHGFQDRQGGRVLVNVERSVNGEVFIMVEDNGIGIAPDTIEHIYEPYFTTKRQQGGSGLGLHITRNLVEQEIKGTITCTSRPGSTRFTISLPVAALDPH